LVEDFHRACRIETAGRGYGRREEEVGGEDPDEEGGYGGLLGLVGWCGGVDVEFAEAGVFYEVEEAG